jgi:hypothetical protein
MLYASVKHRRRELVATVVLVAVVITVAVAVAYWLGTVMRGG